MVEVAEVCDLHKEDSFVYEVSKSCFFCVFLRDGKLLLNLKITNTELVR